MIWFILKDSFAEARNCVAQDNVKEVYQFSSLTKLDDLLGEQWYIRGINATGDFCYIQPWSVKYYLKHCIRKVKYQMQADGTIHKSLFGGQCQLVFQFDCNDGLLTQWNNIKDIMYMLNNTYFKIYII